MLNHIYIRDLAIVSALELDLDPGLTALTGETGAGKSILIDALGLALGDKADPGMVRAGCDKAEIVAEFDIRTCPEAGAWLEEQGLADDGGCLVRRLLVDGGRSRAFINARPATGTQLQQLGERLVDIHGQHAHQSLLRPATQRDLLDAYGGHGALAQAVADLARTYREQDRLLRRLETEGADRAARLDLLRYQVGELEALGMTAAQILDLDQEQRRLGSLGKLQEVGARLLMQFDEAEPSVGDTLRHAGTELTDLAALDPHLSPTLELVEGAAIQVQEAAAALRQYLSDLDLDPRQLERVEARLGQVHDLGRKYRCPPEALPQALEDRRAALASLERADQDTQSLAAARTAARAAYLERAAALSAARAEAARRLGETITDFMHQLGMGGGVFAVALTPLEPDEAGPGGLEHIEFQVSANPGQPLAPWPRSPPGASCPASGSPSRWPRPNAGVSPAWSSTRWTWASAAAWRRSSGACCAIWGPSARSCASPTCPRSPPRATINCWSANTPATARPTPGSSPWLERNGSKRSPACWAGPKSPPRHARTPRRCWAGQGLGA